MSNFSAAPSDPLKKPLPSASMVVTVVMAIFEPHEDYIREQLESIFLQTHLVSELIISDDSWSDRARRIIDKVEFPASMEVRYVRNNENLGYSRNFLSALGLARGKIIFFCDQDDVWLPHKVASVLEVFEKKAGAVLVVHDQIRTDAELNEEPYSTLENYKRKGWSSNNLVHGCASAFRAEIKEIVRKCPDDHQYDEWLHFIGQSVNGRVVLREALMKFRRHPQATTIVASNIEGSKVSFKLRVEAYIARRRRENKKSVSSLKQLITFFQQSEQKTIVLEKQKSAWLNSIRLRLDSVSAEESVLFGGLGLVILGATRLAPCCFRGSCDVRVVLKDVTARVLNVLA